MSRIRVPAGRIRDKDKAEMPEFPVSCRVIERDVAFPLDPRDPEGRGGLTEQDLSSGQDRECTLTLQGFTQLAHLRPNVGRNCLVFPSLGGAPAPLSLVKLPERVDRICGQGLTRRVFFCLRNQGERVIQ